MRHVLLALTLCITLGCRHDDAPKPEASKKKTTTEAEPNEVVAKLRAKTAKMPKLWEKRVGFQTKLVSEGRKEGPPPTPPSDAPFVQTQYASPVGLLHAYLSKDPGDGQRHPAIIWVTGGDNNTIGDVWSPADPSSDQTAAAFRKQGVVMMFPSQRGGNDNPGRREGFLGEVDDIIAARAHLAGVSYVDPERIYLGGHSTGGTLAMLVAETTDQFRATFAFGPVHFAHAYGGDLVYCDPEDEEEMDLRSPVTWMSSVRTPTFVFEGSEGNADCLRSMELANPNPLLKFFVISGVDHFAVLDPINTLIATKLVADVGPTTSLAFDLAELQRLFE